MKVEVSVFVCGVGSRVSGFKLRVGDMESIFVRGGGETRMTRMMMEGME